MKQAGLKTLLGIGFVSMAVLANEITLTRIFSVTLWYHFAFLVISLALLGSGAAGVWLYLAPKRLTGERALPWLALGFAISNLAAFLIYQQIPLTVDTLRQELTAGSAGWLVFMYIDLTVPFIFAGATVALALRQYQAQAGRLYFADLVGASLGCLLSVAALTALGGAGTMLASAVLGALAAFLLALDNGGRLTRLITGAALAAGVAGLAIQINAPWLELRLRHTYNDSTPIFEGWNAFSRITVYDDNWAIPFGWGISQVYYRQNNPDPGHMMILIDEKAGTPIQHHTVTDGHDDWGPMDFLSYDVTSLPYYIYQKPDVFVIGPGGGRDVLTALMFGANRIVGSELNPLIYRLVHDQYADYAGNIYNRPNVDIHVDDARTYLAANSDHFDVIQASLIDTFASTSAGAFALSENGIYTVEAFEDYYRHLNDGGVVNFSRWYYANGPAETLRLVSVALQGWQNEGVSDLQNHIVVIANLIPDRIASEGLAGMLLKKTPFTPEELDTLREQAERLEFNILYAPGMTDASANPIAQLILSPDRQNFIRDYPLDISPATDNRPFFFSVVRPGDLGKEQFAGSAIFSFGAEATRVLLLTLAIAVALAAGLIVLPLMIKRVRNPRSPTLSPAASLTGREGEKNGAPSNSMVSQRVTFIAYFAALGLGFILVEVPMIQKLSIFMGNPTYALALILFSLLLFSGIGSFLSQRVPVERIAVNVRLGLTALVGLIAVYIVGIPLVLKATQGLTVELRGLVVVIVMAPAGLLMGRPFPLGLRSVEASGAGEMMPWLWAANGTLSVVGSVMATIMAINLGFTAVFLVGVLAYALALAISRRFAPASKDASVEIVNESAILPTEEAVR